MKLLNSKSKNLTSLYYLDQELWLRSDERRSLVVVGNCIERLLKIGNKAVTFGRVRKALQKSRKKKVNDCWVAKYIYLLCGSSTKKGRRPLFRVTCRNIRKGPAYKIKKIIEWNRR